MLGIISKILQALATSLPTILDWWQRRQATEAQAKVEDRVAVIRSDPGPAWLREFGGSNTGPGDESTATGKTSAPKSGLNP